MKMMQGLIKDLIDITIGGNNNNNDEEEEDNRGERSKSTWVQVVSGDDDVDNRRKTQYSDSDQHNYNSKGEEYGRNEGWEASGRRHPQRRHEKGSSKARRFYHLAIDGADEVDPHLNLVKGRGGSLLREKMIEMACKKMVESLGMGGAMPVEVVPFYWKYTAEMLQGLFQWSGCVAKLRFLGDGEEPFVTDNSNYIVDLYFEKEIGDLNVTSDAMLRLPGVVEHGMFLDMATTVIVAGSHGVIVKNN